MNRTVSKWLTVFWTALCIAALVFGLLPTANVQAATIVVYDAIPAILPHNVASQPFQAGQASEFGDYVHLAGTNRELRTITVTMSTWAYHSTYPEMEATGWSHPITLNIYNVVPGTPNALGSLLGTKTQTFAIPWRAEPDPTCTDPIRWRAADGVCYGGLAFNITFDLSSLDISLPNDVVLGVAYNTNTWGYDPINQPGPYESLNVGSDNGANVTIGTDGNGDKVFLNSKTQGQYGDTGPVDIFRETLVGWGVEYGTVPFQITAAPKPDVVYVNQAWSAVPTGDDPDGAGLATMMGYDAFFMIQDGVDGVATSGIVNVAAGTYAENLVIGSELSLIGPNAGINPNTGTRSAEAFITYPAGITADTDLVSVSAGNVSINGFTMDGKDLDVAYWGEGVYSEGSNLTITNNIVKNFRQIGIRSGAAYGGPYFTGVLVENNLVTSDNPTLFYYSYSGIYIQGAQGIVRGNVVENASRGIQIQPYTNPATTQGLVENNTIHAYRTPLYFNYSEHANSNWLFKNNVLSGIPNLGPTAVEWDGLLAQTFYAGTVVFEGNIVNIGTTDAANVYMFRKISPIGGTVDLDATYADNTFEKVVVVTDGTNIIHDTFYSKIQLAIEAAANGNTVLAGPGTYVENVVVTKSVVITGENQADVTVVPALSSPNCGGTGTGSLCAGSSNVFLVQANDVTIHDLTVDGDNPNLTSGIVRGTADVDARNGIITSQSLGVLNNLVVYNTTVKNIYLRGIYPSSGGSFNIHHNLVENVRGEAASIAIMNWVGSGVIDHNTVNNANDGIVSNHSKGTVYTYNTVTNSSSGIHSDNNGSSGGVADLIQFNTVSDCSGSWPYGIFVFAPYLNVSVDQNTVTNCKGAADNSGAGISYARPANATALPTFTNNTVSNSGLGVYLTTGKDWGWGGANTTVSMSGNTISGNDTGIYFESDNTFTLTAHINNNTITGNTVAATTGIGAVNYEGTYIADMSGNWWGSNDPAVVKAGIADTDPRVIDYTPWLNIGTDVDAVAHGFQGDFSYLNVDDDSPQTGTVGRIQEGVNLVSGSIVNVAPGTYAENVLVNKYVEIIGAGSGNTAADTIVTTPTTFDSKVGVFQLAASGLSATEPILLQDLRIQPVGQAGISVGRFTEATGVNVSNVSLDNVWVIGTNNNPATEQERGLYVDLTSTLDHLTVTDSAFNNLAYGWYMQKQVSADTSTVSNVVVTNTTFNHNNTKGLYTEKLTEATFTDCTFSGNGFSPDGLPDYFLPWMSGVDINLKAGTYQNISFVNPTVTNNGLGGAKEGVGLALKARNDGASYGLFPATLTNVTVTNGTFTGNERGIRIGEPGKNNPTPTNVQIHLNRIVDNVQTYTGTDGTSYGGVVNQSIALVDATNNWFGCNEGPNDAAGDCDSISGLVDADPWLVLSAAADPASILPLGTSTITADMLRNSAGTTPAGFLPDGILAAYTAPDGGTLTETDAATLDGALLPTTTFTAPAVDQPYRVCTEVDNELLCVNVAVQNVAPVAVDDTAATAEDTALDIPAATLLADDNDANADVLTLTAVSNPTNGTVSLLAGVVTFTPTANFFGTAGFDYTVSDGLLTDTGHVTVTVTPTLDDPVAVDDEYTTNRETELVVSASAGVLANDEDVDFDSMVATMVAYPLYGELTMFADGSFVYTPEPGFVGDDTFTYRLVTYPNENAVKSWTDEAVVTIHVTENRKFIFLPIITR